MQIEFNYSEDMFHADGVLYSLHDLRSYLLTNHDGLVRGHFIKAITVGGKTKFCFDWQTIYFKADQYSIIKNFINDISRNRNQAQ